MNTGQPDEHAAALQSIRALPDPETDPVFGTSSPPE
jgi:uncharacterized protein YjlB